MQMVFNIKIYLQEIFLFLKKLEIISKSLLFLHLMFILLILRDPRIIKEQYQILSEKIFIICLIGK